MKYLKFLLVFVLLCSLCGGLRSQDTVKIEVLGNVERFPPKSLTSDSARIRYFKSPKKPVTYWIVTDNSGKVELQIDTSDCKLVVPSSVGSQDHFFMARPIKQGSRDWVLTANDTIRDQVTEGCGRVARALLESSPVLLVDGVKKSFDTGGQSTNAGKGKIAKGGIDISFISAAASSTLNNIGDMPVGDSTEVLKYDLRRNTYLLPSAWNGRGKIKPKRGNNKPKNSTSIGGILQLRVVNYNPYRDSIRFSISYSDYYSNAEANFKKLLIVPAAAGSTGITTPPTPPSGGASTEGVDSRGIRGINAENTKRLVSSLDQDLSALYSNLYARASINIDSLHKLLGLVDQRISTEFAVGAVNALSLRRAGKTKLSKLPSADSADYAVQFERALTTYRKLHQYSGDFSTGTQIESTDFLNIEATPGRDGRWANDPSKLRVNIVGGWGFGYSVGFMYSPLRDFSYELRRIERRTESSFTDTINNSTTITRDTIALDSVVRKDTGKFAIGALALGHLYYRAGTNLYVALSAGIGIKGELDTHYFLGGSVMLGRRKEVVLTTGYAFAKVDRLGGGLEVGQTLAEGDDQANRITDVREVWKRDLFAAVSFRF